MSVQYRGQVERSDQKIGTARWANGVEIAQKYAYRPGDFWLGRLAGDEASRIGFHKKGHVFLIGATRTGKGRSIIVNNLCTWEGNVISIDPKGENANVTAVRRGPGDEYCEGMGQDVFVLDPFETAQTVPDELRAYYDPLEDLGCFDPDDNRIMQFAELLADAMFQPDPKAGGDSNAWKEKGRQFTVSIIEHLITEPEFEGKRNMVTLRRLLTVGMDEEAEEYNRLEREDRAESGDDAWKDWSGFKFLFESMRTNPAQDGRIARAGKQHLFLSDNFDLLSSITQNAYSETRFLDDPQIQDTVVAGRKHTRTFSVRDIKERRMSVYLCLPVWAEKGYSRWQRLMIYFLMEAIERDKRPPIGGDILISLDEFLSLGHMDRMEGYATSLAGAGAKLFFAVQGFGKLQEIYRKNWETFQENSVCWIWMGVRANPVRKYLAERLGEMEIVRWTRSLSSTTSLAVNEAVSKALGFTETTAEGLAEGKSWNETTGESQSRGTSEGYSTTWNKQRGGSRGRNRGRSWGSSKGRNWGATYDPWSLFELAEQGNRGVNYGRNRGGHYGWNTSESWGKSWGGSRNTSTNNSVTNSHSRSSGGSQTRTVTNSQGRTVTVNVTTGETRTISEGRTQTEGLHKRALLTPDMMNRILEPFDDPNDVRYPGFALIEISSEDPFLIRKCHYDEDPEFIGTFSNHETERFRQPEEIPMLGYQYTSAHFLTARLPPVMAEAGYRARIRETVEIGSDFRAPRDRALLELRTPEGDVHGIDIPGPALVVNRSAPSEPVRFTLRTDQPVPPEEAEQKLWGRYLTDARGVVDAEKDAIAKAKAEAERERRERARELLETNQKLMARREALEKDIAELKAKADRVPQLGWAAGVFIGSWLAMMFVVGWLGGSLPWWVYLVAPGAAAAGFIAWRLKEHAAIDERLSYRQSQLSEIKRRIAALDD